MKWPLLSVAAAALCCGPIYAQELPAEDGAADFPQIVNSQPGDQSPTSPQQAAGAITAPPGFRVTLFAGEPDVSQPIAFDLDDRGRVWVAECYTYAEQGYSEQFRDRIVILEDRDNDGHFDLRRVFWDQGNRLTGLTHGFGGLWILNHGRLQFLPDRDGDDQPDGPPQDKLDGFDFERAGHNIVNGLLWGPDGWLYGRHGILATSQVGLPGAPPHRRQELNCSIWRYHPTEQRFEVVTHGTTNPWGMDYNDWGELFFTNNVIGHLWHVVPGAHYERMYGDDFNPHLYGLIGQTADHYHWDHSQNWTDSRDGRGRHGELGGGHSHCGGMIYLGGRWPDPYRNVIFMCNTHGRRVNQNILKRRGCGYVGLRAPDFLMANNPWFRGVDLKYGPDGNVYLSDWTDLGECHDHDGVHRTSGRIYKVSYGDSSGAAPELSRPLGERSNVELVALQGHANDWFVRRARRLLQERTAAGEDLGDARRKMQVMLESHPDVTRRLRALWALHVTGGAGVDVLEQLLDEENEHLRAWAVRLQAEGAVSDSVLARWAELAADEPSGLVRLHLASALQRLAPERRWSVARALAARSEDAEDPVQPLMLWYAIEPGTPLDPEQALGLAAECRIPLLRRHIARRLTSNIEQAAAPVQQLLDLAAAKDSAFQRDVLQGMSLALRGWRRAPRPAGWESFRQRLAEDGEPRKLADELAVVFGDGRALALLLEAVRDTARDSEERRRALRVLIESRPPDLAPLLHQLLADRSLNALAAGGLAQYDHPQTPRRILQHYRQLRDSGRTQAISTLASRKTYAVELLRAVEAGDVPAADLSAFHARQMAALDDPQVSRLLTRVWGSLRQTPAQKRRQIDQYKKALTPQRLAEADAQHGRLLFRKHCANCHRLFGEGERIGPDITGANRDSLDYLLENMLDPSAVVPADYRMSVVRMKDGRVLNGVLGRGTEQTIPLQTQKERLLLRRDEIGAIRQSEMSLMPDGLLQPLSPPEVEDLMAYLSRRDPLSTSAEASE